MKNCSYKKFKETILYSFNKFSQLPNHRYKSWVHCYKFFQKNRKPNNYVWLKTASLNLAMYLASWGMYRGSAIALQLDYQFYMPIIKILTKKKYNKLWNIKLENWSIEEKNTLIKKYSKNITELIEELKFNFNNNLKEIIIKTNRLKKEKNINSYLRKDVRKFLSILKKETTDTLISKILLGTIGCLPAYDSYFLKGIKKSKTLIARKINNKEKKAFDTLINFYFENNFKNSLDRVKRQIEKINKSEHIKYPIMKLIDTHFWMIGKHK